MSITLPNPPAEGDPDDPLNGNDEDADGEWDEEEMEDEDDSADVDAEAEEIARRLGDQLWADISKAHAALASAAGAAVNPQVNGISAQPTVSHPAPSAREKKELAIIATMRTILECVRKDELARSVLAATAVPEMENRSVFDTLSHISASGTLPKGIANPLSQIVLGLARSEELFANLRLSSAAAVELDKGKRKREHSEEGEDPRVLKRPYLVQSDLQSQVLESVGVITNTLNALAVTSNSDSSIIASIQLHLHRVFLFAVTSSTRGGPEMKGIQEVSGLIQVIGVITGIQIGPNQADSAPQISSSSTYDTTTSPSDIGTAVYPCLVPGCPKTFTRLFGLRAHQRGHASHRPFRCTVCPASFARNHDLKRHSKLHDRKAWKCLGCNGVFSRRDAIKRHKNGHSKNKGEACATADVEEVELEAIEGGDVVREGRRAKMWVDSSDPLTGFMEEGEIPVELIGRLQAAAMSLYPLLQAHVARTLGNQDGSRVVNVDYTAGQGTLAGVIARAQSHSMPSSYLGDDGQATTSSGAQVAAPPIPQPHEGTQTLSAYGLSEEQTKMLEQAIANAASAAQAQAEAEAALEEEIEDEDVDAEGEDEDAEGIDDVVEKG